jgi:hypothetical protein
MGKSRKNNSSSFKRNKDNNAYYEDSYIDTNKNTKGTNKPSKGQRDAKSRDHPSEYIDWDSI